MKWLDILIKGLEFLNTYFWVIWFIIFACMSSTEIGLFGNSILAYVAYQDVKISKLQKTVEKGTFLVVMKEKKETFSPINNN